MAFVLPQMLGFSHVQTNVVLQDLLCVAVMGAFSVDIVSWSVTCFPGLKLAFLELVIVVKNGHVELHQRLHCGGKSPSVSEVQVNLHLGEHQLETIYLGHLVNPWWDRSDQRWTFYLS